MPANAIIRHSDRDKSATWNVGPRNCVGPRVTAQADESDGDGTCCYCSEAPCRYVSDTLRPPSLFFFFFSLGRGGGSVLRLSLILG